MGFLDRLKFGLRLAARSLGVVRANPVLLVFPVASAVFVALFGVVALASVFALGGLGAVFGGVERALGPLGYQAALAAYFFVVSVLATFFNAALVHESAAAMRGEAPSVRGGLAAAWGVIGRILVWGVVSSTVGLVLHNLERDRRVGPLVTALLGASWGILTYFVVPVLVFERTGLRETLTRSGGVLRETWGEGIGFGAGISVAFVALAAVWLVAFVAALVVVPGVLVVPVVVVAFLALGALAAARSAAVAVAKTALYLYATGEEPPGFEGIDFRNGPRTPANSPGVGGVGGRGGNI
ncbi:MAG: DUF6159 family protein [Halobacteriaceae archaeon]